MSYGIRDICSFLISIVFLNLRLEYASNKFLESQPRNMLRLWLFYTKCGCHYGVLDPKYFLMNFNIQYIKDHL